MARTPLGESAGLAWWALANFITRPHALGSNVDLWDALTELGVGTFGAIRSRLTGQNWNRRESETSGKWMERLKEELAPLAFQESDPKSCWERRWDQKWRILAYDVPSRPQSRRLKLWRWLKQNRLGLLQRSLWISAKPLEEIRTLFHHAANSHTLLLWEAPTPTGLNPISIVQQAWNMAEIDSNYQVVLNLAQADSKPENIRKTTLEWQKAVRNDPLLPRVLYPKSFRGFQATEHLEKMWSKFLKSGS